MDILNFLGFNSKNKNIKCIKSLYKSTYNGYAFNEGKKYEIVGEYTSKDGIDFYLVIDNENREFDFCKTNEPLYYNFETYFEKLN